MRRHCAACDACAGELEHIEEVTRRLAASRESYLELRYPSELPAALRHRAATPAARTPAARTPPAWTPWLWKAAPAALATGLSLGLALLLLPDAPPRPLPESRPVTRASDPPPPVRRAPPAEAGRTLTSSPSPGAASPAAAFAAARRQRRGLTRPAAPKKPPGLAFHLPPRPTRPLPASPSEPPQPPPR